MLHIPEYGSLEYHEWRHDLTEDKLHQLLSVTDARQMSTLRSLLNKHVRGLDLTRMSNHDVLRQLALTLRSGRLAVYGSPNNAFDSILSCVCTRDDAETRRYQKQQALRQSAAAAAAAPTPAVPAAQNTRAPATVMTNLIPKRDLALTVNDQFRAQLGAHTPLTDGTRYKLTTDQGEVREGTVSGGKINEAQVTIIKSVWIEIIKPK